MDKVVLISGGGRGLGASITRKLLAEGWIVSLGLRDVSQADAFKPGENRLIAIPYDANSPDDAQNWVDMTVNHFGRIDALVNNAGILRMVDFEQGDIADIDAMWNVNVKAPFLLIRAALPELRKTGSGRIVNIASTDGKRYRKGTSIGYSMTKHALLAITQAARAEGWDDGVRATAICPGAIDTGMIADLPGVTPKADRLQPETVAGMVAFLLALPNQASVPELIANTRQESII